MYYIMLHQIVLLHVQFEFQGGHVNVKTAQMCGITCWHVGPAQSTIWTVIILH